MLELADLVTYEVHELLRTEYLGIMIGGEEPGYTKPSMQQILDADIGSLDTDGGGDERSVQEEVDGSGTAAGSSATRCDGP